MSLFEARDLDPREARVLGALIEKEITTPDAYPLSLAATTTACNQKSNREPVLALPESEVLATLEKLLIRGLVGRVLPAGSRVEKFRHNATEMLELRPAELAVLAELLLRGPQAPGELRQRASRMVPIPSLTELETVLAPLERRGLVRRLSPLPGSRAPRIAQTLAPLAHPPGTPEEGAPAAAPSPPATDSPLPAESLERRVARLERRLAALCTRLGEPLEQLDDDEGPAT